MKRKITPLITVSFASAILSLASCSKDETADMYAGYDYDRICVLKAPDLDEDEFLAYSLHDAVDFDIPVSEAIALMEAVHGPSATTYSSDDALNVTSVRKFGRQTYSDADASAGLYLIELEADGNAGYSICSADKRYPEVFAFVPQGSVSDTVENKALAGFIGNMEAIVRDSVARFNALAQSRYESAVAKIEAKRQEAMEEARYRSATYGVTDPIPPDTSSIWDDPFDFSRCVFSHVDRTDITKVDNVVALKTKWHQCDPYNYLMPYAQGNQMPDPASFKVLAGCVPVAIAQIMAHYRKGYNISADMWNKITEAPNINQLQYPEARTTIQQMIKYIYDGVKATPKADGTHADDIHYLPFLKSVGFSYSGFAPYSFSRVRSDIVANRILFVVGSNASRGSQHAWLINGCRRQIVPEKNVYLCKTVDGRDDYFKVHPNYISRESYYLRCEWGYGGESDGWFYEKSMNPYVNNMYLDYKIDEILYEIK